MTSDVAGSPTEAFVWIWLPEATEPVVCGRLDAGTGPTRFTSARSYRERADAVPIFAPELPLAAGSYTSRDGDGLPLCIDDAMPDSWGRRLVNHRLDVGYSELPDLTYLLESGSDRIGALDFQRSATEHVPREVAAPTLEELADAAHRIDSGQPLDERLELALLRGTSIGGARPKALLDDNGTGLIAKFASTTDTYPVVQGEFVAMTLAARCGLEVAPVRLTSIGGRYCLLVERFDRPGGGLRRRVVSALTVLGLNSFPGGRYATYVDLAHRIRAEFVHADVTLRELFGRIAFNVLCGNTDDHGRNHAAFVDERGLALTPAYDICPQARSGGVAAQAMAYGPAGERAARLRPLVDAAPVYHLDRAEAQEIVDRQEDVMRTEWDDVTELARLTSTQADTFLGGQFLNPGIRE